MLMTLVFSLTPTLMRNQSLIKTASVVEEATLMPLIEEIMKKLMK
jgi:hypothetical protein